MATSNSPISSTFLCSIILTYFTFISCKLRPCTSQVPDDIFSTGIATRLVTDPSSLSTCSHDYGNLVREIPSAVLHPSSVDDLITLLQFSNNCSSPFVISARGRGHSVRGQAMAGGGVVVNMASLGQNGIGIRVSRSPSLVHFADVGGEQIWADVLRATLEYGLAPVSWTDYLHLSVGGTLSNGGISGQSFLYGPQISNVMEMDVVTGRGDLVTCSPDVNSELFFGVLGGLGQFGIITRARIILQRAPKRAKWLRLIYSDFPTFTRDQEHLIATSGPNYVEGTIITSHTTPNNWRSSFYSGSNLSKITSFLQSNKGVVYSIEFVKYYDDQTSETVDEEVDLLLKDLNFLPGLVFKKDVSFVDFLSRVGSRDDDKSLASHPWMNLFVPKSRVLDFNAGVLVNIIGRQNQTSGPVLFYPLYRKKWEDRMSAVTPEEDIFYTLGLLHSSNQQDSGTLEDINHQIIDLCKNGGIKIKQYLPHYESINEWRNHFGQKWEIFQRRKRKFDPKRILSPGQRIFRTADDVDTGVQTRVGKAIVE